MSEHLYDFQHPLTGGTVRSCLDCGLPVYGGPTRCIPCAMGYPDDAKASVEHFVTDATRTLRERNQNLHGVLDRIEKAVGVPTQAATYTADAVEDTIARLTREVAALRLMLRETAQTNATGIDYALRCQRERDTARRWSRLWHAEARRLWREVQDLTDELLEVIDGQ